VFHITALIEHRVDVPIILWVCIVIVTMSIPRVLLIVDVVTGVCPSLENLRLTDGLTIYCQLPGIGNENCLEVT
jgi:hypothetical protein